MIKRGNCTTQSMAQTRISSLGGGIDKKTESLIGQPWKERAGRTHKILNIGHGSG